ncbi:MAG: hypothetical protein HY064_04825 [Bacteroidetes bacterium]|nr:hypothetical protein [Bacteroidota bacterium]
MKTFFLLFLSFCVVIKIHAQVNGIVPEDSIYTPKPFIIVKQSVTDSSGKSCAFLYTRMDYFPRTRIYSFVIIDKKKKILMYNFRPVSKKDMIKQKPDRDSRKLISKYGLADSVYKIDQHAYDSLYTYYPLPSDTIMVKNVKVLDGTGIINTSASDVYQYRGDVKDGCEIEYYNMTELKGVVVRKNFRMRSYGNWKNGEKNGKWFYYAKDGSVNQIEKWKNGKLKRVRNTK